MTVSCLAVCVLFWVGCGELFGGFLLIVLMLTVLCCVVWLCWWFLQVLWFNLLVFYCFGFD